MPKIQEMAAFSLIGIHEGKPELKQLVAKLATALDPHPHWRKKGNVYTHANFNHFFPKDLVISVNEENPIDQHHLKDCCVAWGIYAPCNKVFIDRLKEWKRGKNLKEWARLLGINEGDVHKTRSIVNIKFHKVYDIKTRDSLHRFADTLGLSPTFTLNEA